MKFKMNDRYWIIKEVGQEEFWKDEEKTKDGYYFGRTCFDIQEIWLDKDISIEQKRKTLYHELTHCYRGMYIGFNSLDGQDEEIWCDIVENSHDMIHRIVEEYFRNDKN